jgi:hypothetical protein
MYWIVEIVCKNADKIINLISYLIMKKLTILLPTYFLKMKTSKMINEVSLFLK